MTNLFTRVRDFLTTELGVNEANEAEHNMTFGEIRQRKNGKFILCVLPNEVVAEYSRHRDAVRGAVRRGITVA